MRRILHAALACLVSCAAVMIGTGSASAVSDRPWWDPTYVIESPVNPTRAEGAVESVVLTADNSDSKEVTPDSWVRVKFLGTGFTPGLYYTARVTLREPGTGKDRSTYTWLTYRATEDGKIHGNLRMPLPFSAAPGESIVAVPTIYNANDVRRDGRPKKTDPKCALRCERVAPLAAWTDLTDPQAIVTVK